MLHQQTGSKILGLPSRILFGVASGQEVRGFRSNHDLRAIFGAWGSVGTKGLLLMHTVSRAVFAEYLRG
jgi:hypothetical protein